MIAIRESTIAAEDDPENYFHSGHLIMSFEDKARDDFYLELKDKILALDEVFDCEKHGTNEISIGCKRPYIACNMIPPVLEILCEEKWLELPQQHIIMSQIPKGNTHISSRDLE